MDNVLPVYINKYQKKFALDNWELELKDNNAKYQLIIVVPALEEYKGIIKLLESLSKNGEESQQKTLIIFVINNRADVPKEIKEDNRKSLALIRDIMFERNDNLPVTLSECKINIGLVDASSDGNELPEKDGGVGLARKIGMDLSLQYFNYEEKSNLLVCLDADCTVQDDYLQKLLSTLEDPEVKAGHIQYEHVMPEENTQKLAIICYEIFLRYYVMGLRYAKSPYAIHTIGSTMFCSPESYTKIQGMNKRKAAEDFYFMEKLSKISQIHVIEDTCIYPSNRPSWRVPFGTGQRVQRFLNEEQDEYLLYSFDSFRVLKEWQEIYSKSDKCSAETMLEQAKVIDLSLYDFLVQQKFGDAWSKIVNDSKTSDQFQKQKMFWFDAFKTLKLIHYLRDNGYPQEPMFDALDKAFSAENLPVIQRDHSEIVPDISVQLEYLNILRNKY